MEVFYNMTIVAVTQQHTFVKTNQTVHFKLVNFILYSIQIIPNQVDKKLIYITISDKDTKWLSTGNEHSMVAKDVGSGARLSVFTSWLRHLLAL